MDNMKPFNSVGTDDGWRTPSFRQNVVAKIEEAIHHSGMKVARNSNEMESHVFKKATSRDDYMNMVAKLILHVREMSQQPKPNPGPPNLQNQNQSGPGNPGQPGQQQQGPGVNQQGMAQDPINALQNLASQGSRNQMMGMGPQGPMQQQGVMGPNPNMGMQGQIQNPQAQTATNLLQTLNRPQLNMQLQNKIGGPMGMVPNQGQIGGNMMGMNNPMGNQMQGQMGGPMQSQMMQGMGMQNPMQVPMSGGGNMGQMQCNQVGMGGQMGPNMQGPMPGQMGGMGGNQLVNVNMLHMPNRLGVGGKEMGGYGPGGRGGPAPGQYLQQSPSPSAPSPNMPGPSPNAMGVLGGPMQSPMSMGQPGFGGAPSPSAPLPQHMPQQRGVNMGMVASPQASLNTPGGVGVGSPGGEEAAYREKVRQLSKYIEPLRRMVHRMVSEGENVEKLKKMKTLLDILSNPNKRMPLETLIKCEVVLEKLDFKRGEGLPPVPAGKEQIFNPLLEVVNNCLQSPLANHTLKRTFGSTLDALNGPEIKNLPPPYKVPKREEPFMEIPDVLQGEIARLDSRFKVSLDTMQLAGDNGAISLYASLDSSRLPAVPPLQVRVPRDYPRGSPSAVLPPAPPAAAAGPPCLRTRLATALHHTSKRLPKNCSLGQLLDAWEMSVRQACAPNPTEYNPVPALGI